MNEISILEVGSELRTDSRLLARFLDHRHRTILESIDKYIDKFQELNPIPFQTEEGKPLPQGGFSRSVRYALLNESQCYFLLTLMRNNKNVYDFCRYAMICLAKIIFIVTPGVYAARTMTGNLGRFAYTPGVLF